MMKNVKIDALAVMSARCNGTGGHAAWESAMAYVRCATRCNV